jgi:hypothetical protein
MSLRRPSKDQPESFEFDASSLEAANKFIANYPKVMPLQHSVVFLLDN